jgi:hypothetical protein
MKIDARHLLVGLAAVPFLLATARPRLAAGIEVELFLSTDCPVAARYTPRILQLADAFGARGVTFRAYFPNDLETREGVVEYAHQRKYEFPCELDLGAIRAKSSGVTHVPTVLVRDTGGRIVYRGALGDSPDPSLAERNYVQEALESVLANKPVRTPRTETFGCLIMPSIPPPPKAAVNYAEHVAPILNRHCAECHRPGEVAPFSLTGYENARKWAPMIAQVTGSRRMPPWKAVPGFGEFRDANRLSELQLETLKRWNDAGAPRGDPKKEPRAPTYASGWGLGNPDLILQPAKPHQVDAEGPDEYRHFVLKTDFKETRWVRAMAVKPGNPRIVHHVIAFLDERGRSHAIEARTKDGKQGYASFGGLGFLPDGSLGGWAPGLRPQETPDGIAFELKPGTTIVMQVHYHRSGKPESDQTRIGLYFAKPPIQKTMNLAWLANPMFRIPAGDASHRVAMTFPIPADVTVYSVMPHMHLLGRSMKAEAVLPDGARKPLIFVKEWDFNWQLNYMFAEPLKLPKGSRVEIEAVYDNSAQNPNQPSSPPKPVTWGEETTDEMFLLIASYTVDGQSGPIRRRIGFGGGGG